MSDDLKKGGDFDKNPPVTVNQYDASMKNFCGAYEQISVMAQGCLQSVVNKEADLLIVGAGTGAELCQFGQSDNKWKMTGVDPSIEMLSIAKAKVEELNIQNIEWVHGYTSDIEDGKLFDGATCILVMHFLEDDGGKLNLLKDISSKLKVGAPLVIVDAFGDKNSEEYSRLLGSWKQFVVINGVDKQVVEDGFNNQILQRLKFVTEDRLQELFTEAGFSKGVRFYTSFLYGGWMLIKER